VSADEAIAKVAPLSAEQGATEEAVFVSGLGNVVSSSYDLGPSPFNNRTYDLGQFSLTTDMPEVVLIQPRQIGNVDENFPDQFAVQVITTARDRIRCRVRRIDRDLGWGQRLRLDLFVVERRAV
jgi:hypothetical protein